MTLLDHVGIIVRDLPRAAGIAERLGFTLTPPAQFEARDSVQQTIMFEQGYLELQQIFDPHGGHPLAPAARRYSGAHIVAFGVADAAAEHARAALPVGPLQRWSRVVDHAAGPQRAEFLFFAAPYHEEEAFLCWVQHLTPAALRSAALVDHANGAMALTGIGIVTHGDLTALIERYIQAGGRISVRDTSGCVLRFGTMTVTLRRSAGQTGPATCYIDTVSIAVREADFIAREAASLGLECAGCATSLRIDLLEQWGITLEVCGRSK